MLIVNKEDCSISIENHYKIPGLTGINKQIRIKFGHPIKQDYFVTNAGILKLNCTKTFCPKLFYEQEAKRYVENLGEEILIEDYKNAN